MEVMGIEPISFVCKTKIFPIKLYPQLFTLSLIVNLKVRAVGIEPTIFRPQNKRNSTMLHSDFFFLKKYLKKKQGGWESNPHQRFWRPLFLPLNYPLLFFKYNKKSSLKNIPTYTSILRRGWGSNPHQRFWKPIFYH